MTTTATTTVTSTTTTTSSASLALQFNIENVLNSFAQYLANFFDQELIFYQHEDITSYRGENNITNPDKLSAEAAREHFQRYVSQRATTHGSYRGYITATFPLINEVLGKVSINFSRNIRIALQRIKNDLRILQRGLLQELQLPIKLSNIHITTSDLHKQGQQVLIFEFIDP